MVLQDWLLGNREEHKLQPVRESTYWVGVQERLTQRELFRKRGYGQERHWLWPGPEQPRHPVLHG